MGTQLESGSGKLARILLLACFVWAFVMTASARAAVAVSDLKCFVNQVFPPAPAMPYWQIKGTGKVTGIPAGNTQVQVEVRFLKKPNGGAGFLQFMRMVQTAPVVNNEATFDTGFLPLTPAPAQGDQYKIQVPVTYMDPGPPPGQKDTIPQDSPVITPLPPSGP